MSVNILLVDDEEDIRSLYRQKFRKQIKQNELHFTFAENGVEALKLLEEIEEPDLILTDINMPEMDGITLTSKVRALNPRIRIVVITAYGDMSNIRKAMNEGAFDFLTKPINFTDLVSTIDKAYKHGLLLEAEKEDTEKRLAGGFAHEMRNSLAGPKLLLDMAQGYDGPGKGSSYTEKNIKLLNSFLNEDNKLLALEEIDAGALEAALQEIKETEVRLDEILQVLRRSVHHGLNITREIMSYARIGEEKMEQGEVDINELIKELVRDSEEEYSAQGIKINLNLPPETRIQGHRTHFYSIFKNIIQNARDALVLKGSKEEFSSQNGKYISLTAEQDQEFYRLKITDNGTGIEPRILHQIFEAFFSTKPNTGTGLGLGMVKKIINLYNGKIEVESEPGKGSTFEIMLPLKRSAVFAESVRASINESE